ncbi:MAG: glycosyltransferase [Gammaproteobacteria bacterium]|nr:glycosyltransferase [Gammaproteobacteria bacterium]
MLVSIIIRTYNEQKYLDELLQSIKKQQCEDVKYEIILVDSGSTDDTLNIAKNHTCRITNINKEEFTFGRSLNIGCQFSQGEILVFISGHCIPLSREWLVNLIKPIINQTAVYTYGRQVGNKNTKFSEHQVFSKYYSTKSKIPQDDFFCNNANSALLKEQWIKTPYCESLTGLEDMYLAQELVKKGQKIAYVANSEVVHIHEESWLQIRTRYEREAIALQKIMPEIQINLFDFINYYVNAVIHDLRKAKSEGVLFNCFNEIVLFRLMQYWGGYKGNHEHRKLSSEKKKKYFYPKN